MKANGGLARLVLTDQNRLELDLVRVSDRQAFVEHKPYGVLFNMIHEHTLAIDSDVVAQHI